jgi:hypothetical protein
MNGLAVVTMEPSKPIRIFMTIHGSYGTLSKELIEILRKKLAITNGTIAARRYRDRSPWNLIWYRLESGTQRRRSLGPVRQVLLRFEIPFEPWELER